MPQSPSRRKPARTALIVLGAILICREAAAQSGVDQECGGAAGPNCAVGLFCETGPGQCAEDDPVGRCVVRTEACTRIYRPVCGCDGKTYGNDCERIAAAARKDHDGACKQ